MILQLEHRASGQISVGISSSSSAKPRMFHQRSSRLVRKWNVFWDRSLRPLGSFAEWFSIRPSVKATYGTVRIAHLTLSEDAEPFVASARDALFLIRCSDPRAWNMIEREVCYVVDTYLTSMGAYRRRERSCEIDFERCFSNDYPEHSAEANRAWRVARVASTIVHEATHGRLHALGFRYNKATRARIERICVRRQHHFLARLPKDQFDFTALAYPFDARRWEPYWDRKQHKRLRRAMFARFWHDVRRKRE